MGNKCSRKEMNRDMIQDEIMSTRDRPEQPDRMAGRQKGNGSDDSGDSYANMMSSMLNVHE